MRTTTNQTAQATGLLSPAMAAARLGLTRRRVTQLLAAGRFPNATRLGAVWLIPAADVEAFEPNPPGNPNWRQDNEHV